MSVRATQRQQKHLCGQDEAITLPYQNGLCDLSPLGLYAGDTNLYRYVGNDPTNEIDPTGLKGEDVKRPFEVPELRFGDRNVAFEITTGLFNWKTAPWSAEDADEGWWGKDDKGVYSRLRIYGRGTVNSCNTPFTLASGAIYSHAGSIVMRLRDLSNGTYDVKIKVKVEIEVSPRLVKKDEAFSPTVNLKKYNAERHQVGDNLWSYRLAKNKTKGSSERELTVRVNYRNPTSEYDFGRTSDMIVLQPTMSFTGAQDKFIEVTSYMRVLDIKKVDE